MKILEIEHCRKQFDGREVLSDISLTVEQGNLMIVDAFAVLCTLQGQQQGGLCCHIIAAVLGRGQVLKLDGKVLLGVDGDGAIDDVAARLTVQGLHHRVDDQAHVLVGDHLVVHFLNQPHTA